MSAMAGIELIISYFDDLSRICEIDVVEYIVRLHVCIEVDVHRSVASRIQTCCDQDCLHCCVRYIMFVYISRHLGDFDSSLQKHSPLRFARLLQGQVLCLDCRTS